MSDITTREVEGELRGTILRMLDESYGRVEVVTFKSIARVADRKETDAVLLAAIRYVVDAGYASERPRKKLYVDQETIIDYCLTPNGKKLVDRITDDSMVIF